MTSCAIVATSEFNAEQFALMDAEEAFDFVMAVDGGLLHLDALSRKPDLAIGDFDSLGYIPKGMRVSRFSPHKNKSDMELAFDRAWSQRLDPISVFGALGGRLDHTLANVQIFARFCERGMHITVYDFENAVTFITGPEILELPAKAEGVVSVFSMNDASRGVFERGLEYELDDAVLTNRSSLGLSNEFQGEAALVGVESGTLMIIQPL